MTTPFPFQAGAVLQAAQLNAITELVTNTQTNDYTLAATDAGDRVIANKATAITFTVPNSVFTAAQIVRIHNIGAGTLTISAGAGLTLNGADVLTLSQYQGGELFFTSASSAIFFPTAKTVSAGGLVRVDGGSFTTATSVSFPNDTFTSTHDNYVCMLVLTALTSNASFSIRLRASGSDNTISDYWRVINGTQLNATSWSAGEANTTPRYFLILNLLSPKLSQRTGMFQQQFNINQAGNAYAYQQGGGVFDANTSFDSASFISSVASSMTGTYNVYGYANS